MNNHVEHKTRDLSPKPTEKRLPGIRKIGGVDTPMVRQVPISEAKPRTVGAATPATDKKSESGSTFTGMLLVVVLLALVLTVASAFSQSTALPGIRPLTGTVATSGSSTPAAPSLATYFTNINDTIQSPNTNECYVTGAGTAAANGKYLFCSNIISGGVQVGWVRTNASVTPTTFLIMDFLGNGGDSADGAVVLASTTNNADAAEYYTLADGQWLHSSARWTVNTGTGPAPSILWGTNYTTRVTPAYYSVLANGSRFWTAWTNLQAVLSAASAGDTIQVLPGLYNENNLLKNGVNWKFLPGAKIAYIESDPEYVRAIGLPYGLGVFDDRTHGAVTNVIEGDSFSQDSSDFETCQGLFYTTNPATHIVLKANTLMNCGFSGGNANSAVYVHNCGFVDITAREVKGISSSIPIRNFATGAIGTYLGNPSGLTWDEGEEHCHIGMITNCSAYGLWGADRGQFKNGASNWYVDCDALYGRLYTDCTNASARTWINIKLIDATQTWNGGGTPIQYIGEGRHYLNCQKAFAQSGQVGFIMNNGVQIWANLMKLTAGGNFVQILGAASPLGTEPLLFLYCQQFDENGNVTLGINNGWNGANPSSFYIAGQRAVCHGSFIGHGGGNLLVEGFDVDCSAGTADSVTVSATGLALKNCLLYGNAGKNSINAGTAQNVAVYSCAANTAKGANVTLTPNGGLTVDTNVR